MSARLRRMERALLLLSTQHEPYIPEVVAVLEMEDGAEWRDATLEDKAESLEWWCDGCNRSADRCTVLPVVREALL